MRTVDREVGSGAQTFTLARERVVALRMVEDHRVAVPERVVMRSGGAVVVTMPRVDGIDLDALLARRAFLSLGECVYLGEQLCGAVASLHQRGLVHGDISAANVMITRAGVTLVDTVGGALPHELGTEGSRAPERSTGASAAADVYSVGAVLAACVDPAMRQEFMGWLDPLLDQDPTARPQARGVAAGLGQCAPAVPVQVPDIGMVGELRAHAREPRERTSVLRSSRPWRMRRMALRVAMTAIAALAVVGIAAYVVPRADSAMADSAMADSAVNEGARTGAVVADLGTRASAGDAYGGAPTAGHTEATTGLDAAAGTSETAPQAARALTNARFVALAAGDPDALLATAARGSAVEVKLREQARALAAGNLRFDGVAATVTGVKPAPSMGGGDSAIVTVTYVVSAHSVWRHDPATGAEQTTRIKAHSEVARLELRQVGPTWLVARVLPQS